MNSLVLHLNLNSKNKKIREITSNKLWSNIRKYLRKKPFRFNIIHFTIITSSCLVINKIVHTCHRLVSIIIGLLLAASGQELR